MWAPAGFFSLAQPQKYGTPQGPTGRKELQPFSQPLQDVDKFRAGVTQAQVIIIYYYY